MRRRHRIGQPCVGFGLARWVRRAAFVRLLDTMRMWVRLNNTGALRGTRVR
jgi:hypothetical protein